MKMPSETYKNSLFLLKNFKKLPLPENLQWRLLYDYIGYLNETYELTFLQRFVWRMYTIGKGKNDVTYAALIACMKCHK